MSLSPTKHRTLSRQPSSPSLAVGLPPALPESNIMQPSSPSKVSKSKSRKRIHRGDVSSSAASSENEQEDSTQITPKRKIINPADAPLPPSTGKKAKKKLTLQERLAVAANAKAGAAAAAEGGMKAKVKSSRSIADMSEVASVAESSSAASMLMTPQTRSEILSSRSTASSSSSSDKVVVCVRIKPTTNPFANIAYDITPTSLTLSDEHPKVKQRGGKAGREDGYTYTFDKLLQYPSTTPELYGQKVAPLVDKAMHGFNSTIFAYGQTGSGKSFTMTGTSDELGVIPCAVDGVFDAITADTERAFLLRVSYIEIYNETLRDLLNFKKGPLKDDEKPAIHYAKGKVYVDPLVEEIVSTPQDVIELLEKGNAQRRIGATDWNERSSRSHCVFTIVIESRPRDGNGDDDIRLSRLNLIDLAGSEKAVSDSERRGEGKHINQSLLALREVINKLTEKTKATHIPYRNSKLTHLLENALGGDSNICVICTMSAEEEHCGETLETLKFAGRCSQVKTNAKKNILQSSERALIKAKDQEIEELKSRLATLTSSESSARIEPQVDQISNLAESVAAMEARKAKLVSQLSKLNGEILTSELPRSGSGLPLSPPKPKRRRISDFSAIVASGSGRTGIGLGTPKKTVDRRAISGMSRLTEENEEMAGIMGTLEQAAGGDVAKSFDQDRALAAARRNLAIKEEELVLANRNLASALARASQLSDRDLKITSLESELKQALDALASTQESLLHSETDLKDRNAQLEITRTELVSTIEERSKKIDELENKLIHLRNSREELVMEDQVRLDEVQKQVDAMKQEKEDLMMEVQTLKSQSEIFEKEKKEEVEKLTGEIVKLSTQQTEKQVELEAMSLQVQDHESTISTLRNRVDTFSSLQETLDAEIATLRTEKSLADRQTEEARADLDRFQREAMSNEAKVLGELRAEIGNLRKGRDEDRLAWEKQRVELEGEVQEEKRRREERERELDGFRKDAEENRGKTQGMQEQINEMLRKLDEAAKVNAVLETQLRQESEAKAAIAKERDEARDRLVAAGGAEDQLQSEIAARTALQAQFDGITHKLDATTADFSTQLQSLQDVEEKLATAQKDLEIQEKRLETESAARVDAEKKIDELNHLKDQAIAAEKEKERVLEEEKVARGEVEKRVQQLSSQREANLKGVKEMRRKLDAEVGSRKGFEQELLQLKEQAKAATLDEDEAKTKLVKEIAAKEEIAKQLNKLTDDFTALSSTVKDKEDSLKSALSNNDSYERQLASLTKEHEATKLALQAKETEITISVAATQEVERKLAEITSQNQNISGLQEQLQTEINARRAAELHLTKVSEELVHKHESAQQILEEELLSIRQALKTAQREVSDSQVENESHKIKIDQLSSELQSIKSKSEVTITTSISSRLRHSAPGPGHGIDRDMSATALDSLRSRSRRGVSSGTGTLERDPSLAMLRGREEEEIERLERIIEVQKEIIDEQREKIERWGKEMEKQREIVRLLTNDNTAIASAPSPSPLPIRAGSPRGHGKSHSISHSPMPSPLPNAKGLVSTFTARNLALPTSPSPLPMHPTQFSNSSSRTRRRVTIEHDMDRLTETSKVNKAKAIFESPEKNSTMPATPPKIPLQATQSVRSVPRQRRP
ncbi:hypothetical protein I302_106115 [Kwoniella bestiolae CBS 10118]|uniref:Kinesin motor domain-containing protein n=1 Tax=Kwoniella bestiolae CBS 10118 TaxID=1296100 RepID=A0A1B9G320_9TREE|nr:hypothetical protein I302_05239 [Kwoniella bestiolae CBS 10118]OCF25419.1 hypothetical protein I302_05239 [Kwoniella bestiolae CBS 10118]